MGTGARLILLKNNRILFIHRRKPGKDYYVLPGGSIKKGETPEDAVLREVKEETGFDAKLEMLLWNFTEIVDGKRRKGYYFLSKEFKGKLRLGGPEAKRQSISNEYIFEWIPVNKLDNKLIYPDKLREKIVRRFLK